MGYCTRLNKRLDAQYHGQVRAYEEDGCLILRGTLSDWDEIVRIGLFAVRPHRYAGLINDIRLANTMPAPMRIPSLSDRSLEGQHPDVLVIGGGIVGCAIARELTRNALDVLLLEKEHDVAMKASSHNDGMVHPGIDLFPGQVKRRYNRRGNRMYDAITRELDVPFRRTGQYLCMQTPRLTRVAFFAQIYFLLTGVPVRFLAKHALQLCEPSLSNHICGALFFPTAGTVCPYGLTIAYAENAASNGARFCFDTAVLSMQVDNNRIVSASTNRGTLYPRVVVNAAGVFSDTVAEMAQDRFFTIHPRRGTNAILDHNAASQVRTIASSFGTSSTRKKHSKGGGCVHTVEDNLLIGPDAVETCEREDAQTRSQSIEDTFKKQRYTDPALQQRDIIAYFTGIRAATYEEDFVIQKGRRTKNLVHAAGIQSPGLTAAPAIAVDVAKMVTELIEETGQTVQKNAAFSPIRHGIVRPRELSDSARDALIAQNPDYGEIICRCEQVSRGEILDALRRSIPCDTPDGVKRRVRPGMGRCQGGFCGPLVLSIIAAEKGVAPTQIGKCGPGSAMLLSETKSKNE